MTDAERADRLEGKWVYVMANIPVQPVAVGEEARRVWFEYEIQCEHTRPATDKKAATLGFKRFIPDRGRTGKGLVQFYATGRYGSLNGLRTIDVEDIVFVSGQRMAR